MTVFFESKFIDGIVQIDPQADPYTLGTGELSVVSNPYYSWPYAGYALVKADPNVANFMSQRAAFNAYVGSPSAKPNLYARAYFLRTTDLPLDTDHMMEGQDNLGGENDWNWAALLSLDGACSVRLHQREGRDPPEYAWVLHLAYNDAGTVKFLNSYFPWDNWPVDGWKGIEVHWIRDAVNGGAEVFFDGVKVHEVWGYDTANLPGRDPGDHGGVRYVHFGAITATQRYKDFGVVVDNIKIADTYIGTEAPSLKGVIEVYAYVDSEEVSAAGEILETGYTFATPATIEVDPGAYTIELTYNAIVEEYPVTVLEGQTIRVEGQFQPPSHLLGVSTDPLTGVPFTVIGVTTMSVVVQDNTPWSGSLEEGSYEVELPSNVDVSGVIHNFVQWEDGSTNPVRVVSLLGAMQISGQYEEAVIPPPLKGVIAVHAYVDSEEVSAAGEILETGYTFATPATIEVDPGAYTIELTYGAIVEEYPVTVLEGQTIRVDGQMTPPKPSVLMPRVRERFYTRIPRVFDRIDKARKRLMRSNQVRRG